MVVDPSATCACKPCGPGECICGNHVVESGEECDPLDPTPCCVGCVNTTLPCDDGNGCTDGDTCDGKGVCKGDYKCPASTDCATITCTQSVGTCDVTPKADGSGCGNAPYNLCNQRCASGECQTSPFVCPPDNNDTDCLIPMCNATTGSCDYVPADGIGCSDGNPCTINDICTNGVCNGTAKICPATNNPCQTSVCSFGDCVIIQNTGQSCNADNSLCTVDDLCVRGVCTPGTAVVCETTDVCKISACDATTGACVLTSVDAADNISCNDGNGCTKDDRCREQGTCEGDNDDSLALICFPPPPDSVQNPAIIAFSIAGAAALIGAIVGIAFLIRKIRNSQLMNPDSWNPDMFSSVGANPLYKGNKNVVDNALYADPK